MYAPAKQKALYDLYFQLALATLALHKPFELYFLIHPVGGPELEPGVSDNPVNSYLL